jgi:mono/diheme cytochrome c family protein
MKRILITLVALFAVAMIVTSCGGGQTTEQKDNATVAAAGALPADVQAMMPRGEELYKTKCVACHQATGMGVPNVFPPLANSDYLMADKVRAVAQTLNGSKMEMMVNGAKYTQEMPQQVNTKEDAVAVINYVLNNFGNKGGYVTMDQVKDVQINPRVAAPATK